MKTAQAKLSFLIIFFIVTCGIITAQETREYYILKNYALVNAQQEKATDQFLSTALLPALKRLKIGPVGVFKSHQKEKDSLMHMYVLIPLKTLQQLEKVDELILTDARFKADGKAFLNAPHDNPPFHRVSTSVLKAFAFMPKLQKTEVTGDRKDRVYELRSYESASPALYRNKVQMFNEGGEIALFEELGFNAVFYAEVLAGANQPNLVYMTTFPDMETRDRMWKVFVDSPGWKEMSSDPMYQNNVSHADIMLLYPTPYSEY